MTKEDFVGTWTVGKTSGTPFGLGTTIHITSNGSKLAAQVAGKGVTSSYDDDAKFLTLTLTGMAELVLAVYVDDESGSGYRALYGVGRVTNELGGVVGLGVCGAELDSTPSASAAERPSEMSVVDEDAAIPTEPFLIEASSGTQYGILSRIEFQTENGDQTVTITNALGQVVAQSIPLAAVVGTSTTYKGTIPEDEFFLQCSFVTLGESGQRVFGINVVGDPNNSGVWGSDSVLPPEGL